MKVSSRSAAQVPSLRWRTIKMTVPWIGTYGVCLKLANNSANAYPELIIISVLARARGARRFQRAVRAAPSRTTGSSRRCGCWPTSPFRFSGLLFADLGATMELGRSAPMLTWASPGRAAAMVPAPVEGSEVRGHRQLCQILQHRQWTPHRSFGPWASLARDPSAAAIGMASRSVAFGWIPAQTTSS